jgi:hypothetical protein
MTSMELSIIMGLYLEDTILPNVKISKTKNGTNLMIVESPISEKTILLIKVLMFSFIKGENDYKCNHYTNNLSFYHPSHIPLFFKNLIYFFIVYLIKHVMLSYINTTEKMQNNQFNIIRKQ